MKSSLIKEVDNKRLECSKHVQYNKMSRILHIKITYYGNYIKMTIDKITYFDKIGTQYMTKHPCFPL